MPFFDLQGKLGINIDQWLILQSSKQPYQEAGICHAFEKEWVECAHGIGQTRAKKECALEFEDFKECISRNKTMARLTAIQKQKEKLMKEGKYIPPYSKKAETDS